MTARMVRVGDVLRLERTRIEPDMAATYRQIGIYSWGKGVIENPPISGTQLSKVTYYRFPPGALLLSNIQAWEAALAVSTEVHATNFIASQRFLPYVPVDPLQVDVTYLLNYFLSDPGMVLIREASPGTITRNRTLGMHAFENLQIPLPDIDRQLAIAARVNRVAAIARRSRVSQQLADALPLAARNAVFNNLRNAAHVRVADVLTACREPLVPGPAERYRPIGVRSFGRGLIRYPECSTDELGKLRFFSFPTNALILSNIKAWEGAVAMSSANDERRIMSNRFLAYWAKVPDIDLRFVWNYLVSETGVAALAQISPGSADRNRTLSIRAFEAMSIPMPDLLQQREIVSQLERLERVRLLRSTLTKLADAAPSAARNEIFGRL